MLCDKYVCIKTHKWEGISINKIYTSKNGVIIGYIEIINDFGIISWYPGVLFKSLSIVREEKLNLLGI